MQAACGEFLRTNVLCQIEKPCCGCAGDHGFQLGELNLPQDKRNVYDFDIRIHRASLAPSFLVLRALVLTRQFARA